MTIEIVQGAPELVWVAPNHDYENIWGRPLFTHPFDEEGTEYVRADLALPPRADRAALVDAANALIECLEEGASPRVAIAQLRELIASSQAEELKGR